MAKAMVRFMVVIWLKTKLIVNGEIRSGNSSIDTSGVSNDSNVSYEPTERSSLEN